MTPPEANKTFVLIGHPVGHSLSPAIHEAAYGELGLAGHRYITVDCRTEVEVREQVSALRRGHVAGANVTVPWKRLAMELADEVDPSARKTGAANVLRPSAPGSSLVVAHNTDVPALAAELRRGRPSARGATILGNGGAALAAVVACRSLGIAGPFVTTRSWAATNGAPWARADEFTLLGARPVPWPGAFTKHSEFHDAITESDLIIQSTSDGMHGASDGTSVRDVVPWPQLRASVFAYDVVYNPAETPFVQAARAHGFAASGGLGMLVGQAALSIELWLGRLPDEGMLRNAALRALAEKAQSRTRT